MNIKFFPLPLTIKFNRFPFMRSLPNNSKMFNLCLINKIYLVLEPLYGLRGLGITFLHTNSYFLNGVNSKDIDTNERMIQQFIDIKFYIHWIRGIFNKHVCKYISL